MYNTIADAYEDMKEKGYVLIGSFKDKDQLDAFFEFYTKLEERLEASKKAMEEYRKNN